MPAAYSRGEAVRAAQIRLLYGNAPAAIGVTLLAAAVLGFFQWDAIGHPIILSWAAYMVLISAARFVLNRLYLSAGPDAIEMNRWESAFTAGTGFAALGWGGAGILLYPPERLINQIFLIFVIGGMMLGGSFLLAPRRAAFVTFLLVTGLLPAARLFFQADPSHLGMGLLATVFTAATIFTTWRLFRIVESSLQLQFENRDLVEDLRIAKDRAESLNQELEARVQKRTAELEESTKLLRAEIQQREEMEEELLRARNLQSLGVLAGGIAHDFNNFLTVVQGNIELARIQLDGSSPAQEALDQTTRACERAAFLASQLLTFAKGGAPVRRVVSIRKVIVDAVALARAGGSVTLDVQIAEDLWRAEADAGQIRQALHNVLLNARQATAEGGTIEVRAVNVVEKAEKASGGFFVRISVKDYGCGIPADVLPRIFDPYFTTKQTGSGLGLATAYAIVSKHGGRLSVDSKPGQGSEFVIDLPASQERPVQEAPPKARLRSGSGRLLVMDDEESLLKLLERVLLTLGYEVKTARDGAEAIALYEAAKADERDFDAVLLDVTVNGGMGGVEAAARIRKLDPTARLVVSSGYSDAPVMSSFREFGFDDVIPKPWTTAALSEVFRRVIAAGGK